MSQGAMVAKEKMHEMQTTRCCRLQMTLFLVTKNLSFSKILVQECLNNLEKREMCTTTLGKPVLLPTLGTLNTFLYIPGPVKENLLPAHKILIAQEFGLKI